MRHPLSGQVLALALGAVLLQLGSPSGSGFSFGAGSGGSAGPEPNIVWKGINCGPGPIVREGPQFGSGLFPAPRTPSSVPRTDAFPDFPSPSSGGSGGSGGACGSTPRPPP